MATQIERERFVYALVFAAATDDHEALHALHDDVVLMSRGEVEALLMSVALCFGDCLRTPGVETAPTLALWGAELAARAAAEAVPGDVDRGAP